MKSLLMLFFVVLLVSCGQRPPHDYQYAVSWESVIPDSNKQKAADFIIKTVSASNLHMTGGDYEDPEDVVEEATNTAKQLYSVESPVLTFVDESGYGHRLSKTELNGQQKAILDSLLK